MSSFLQVEIKSASFSGVILVKFLFFLFLALIVLFLIFGWKEKAQFIKSSKPYKEAQEATCKVKSNYQSAEKWTKKQVSTLKKVSEKVYCSSTKS